MRKYAARLAIGSIVISVFLGLSGSVNADSTIGTNISTTGTLTVKSNSTSAVSFQNAAGSSTLVLFNSAALRLGINYGSSLDASFEVGGTASANYLVTRNAAQIGNSGATVAYSRFGANATGHANYVTAAGDILVSGDLEVDGSVSFAGPASVSGILFLADGQVRPRTDATTAFRFQNAAGGTTILTVDSTNTRLGVGAVNTLDTALEVAGVASASGGLFVGAANNATTSITFDSIHATRGACLEIKDRDGSGFTYLRVNDGTGTFSTISCK